jgi:hypothetical protein
VVHAGALSAAGIVAKRMNSVVKPGQFAALRGAGAA